MRPVMMVADVPEIPVNTNVKVEQLKIWLKRCRESEEKLGDDGTRNLEVLPHGVHGTEIIKQTKRNEHIVHVYKQSPIIAIINSLIIPQYYKNSAVIFLASLNITAPLFFLGLTPQPVRSALLLNAETCPNNLMKDVPQLPRWPLPALIT